jgi:hypothetical protein
MYCKTRIRKKASKESIKPELMLGDELVLHDTYTVSLH